MELQYFGGNCVRLGAKKASLVIDDNLADLGAKSITKPDDIVLISDDNVVKVASGGRMTVAQPGEYEISNITVQGVAARSHMDEENKRSATIFKVQTDDIRLVFMGHVHPDLTDDELEAIGMVDVLVIPVGGGGYTLDPLGALKVIKKIEPRIVIPTHYADSKLKYEVPQQDLMAALKELGMEVHETVPKLKLKGSDIPESMQVIVLERQ